MTASHAAVVLDALATVLFPTTLSGLVHRLDHPLTSHTTHSILVAMPRGSMASLFRSVATYLPHFEQAQWCRTVDFVCHFLEMACERPNPDHSIISSFCRNRSLINHLLSYVRDLPLTDSSGGGSWLVDTVCKTMDLVLLIFSEDPDTGYSYAASFLATCQRGLLFEVLERILAPDIANDNTHGEQGYQGSSSSPKLKSVTRYRVCALHPQTTSYHCREESFGSAHTVFPGSPPTLIAPIT